MFVFEDSPLWLNGSIFLAGAVVIWLAGTRLTRYADAISTRTRLSHALIGALLLGGITSLPELATTSTAALGGNAPLAVNNLLGGVAMQVGILAVADAMVPGEALSSLAGASSLLLQSNGLMLVLALTAAAISAGSMVFLGVDLWTAILAAIVVGVFASIQRFEDEPHWRPAKESNSIESTDDQPADDRPMPHTSNRRLAAFTFATGLVVIVGGYLVTRSGDAIAVQTGLGASFFGAIFLAAATSLPEVSTTIEAVRRGHHRLAFSNIVGTNLLDVSFLLVADVLYREGPVLDEVGAFSVFAAMLGILLTGTYAAGILQRRKTVILRLGLDSIVVVVVYVAGAAILYGLR